MQLFKYWVNGWVNDLINELVNSWIDDIISESFNGLKASRAHGPTLMANHKEKGLAPTIS